MSAVCCGDDYTSYVMYLVLREADAFGEIKIAFHLEPYPSRSALSVKEDIQYLSRKYGQYECLLRDDKGRPFYYIYDSYHITSLDWASVLTDEGTSSIRGILYLLNMIGLPLSLYIYICIMYII